MNSNSSSEPDRLADLARGEVAADIVADRLVAAGLADAGRVSRVLREYHDLIRHGAPIPFSRMLAERGVVGEVEGLRILRDAGFDLFACAACRFVQETGASSRPWCPSCARPMERASLAASQPAGDATASLPRPDDVYGRYRILAELGRGGSGVVFKAYDSSIQRTVALKFLREDMRRPELLERFQREAVALGRVSHPNIVGVFETGTHGGLAYIAMELIEGIPLSAHVAQRGIRLRERVALLEQVALAVHHAHAMGVIHRDLKPGNILVETAASRVVVMDFGLARLTSGSTTVTSQQSAVGTPFYMAPEQVEGRGREIDARTDVYGLGVILYEMATGRVPHRSTTLGEVYHAILESEPLAPRQIDPSIPRDLQTICLKCLEKDPARRYPSARALADDLRRFLNGEPTLARPLSMVTRAARRIRRRPLAWTLGAAMITAIVAGTFLLGRLSEIRRRHDVEIAVKDAAAEVKGWWRERYLPLHDATAAWSRLNGVLPDLDAAIAAAPRSAPAWEARGRVLLHLGRIEEAERSLGRAVELDPERGECRFWLGYALAARQEQEIAAALWIENEFDGARIRRNAAWFERAVQEFQAAMTNPSWTGEQSWERDFAGIFVGAREAMTDEIRLSCDRMAQDHPEGGEEALLLKAGLELRAGRPAEAAAACDEACDRARSYMAGYVAAARIRSFQAEQPGFSDPQRLALHQSALDKAQAAAVILPAHPAVRAARGLIRIRWGGAVSGAGTLTSRPMEGDPEELLRQAIDQDFGPAIAGDPGRSDIVLFRGHARLSLAIVTRSRKRDAPDLLQEAIGDFTAVLVSDPRSTAALLQRGRARALLARGRADADAGELYRAALQDFSAALEIQPDLIEPRHQRGSTQSILGELLASRGADPSAAYEAGAADLERVTEREPSYVNSWMSKALLHLGWARHRCARGGDGRDNYRDALKAFREAFRLVPALETRCGAHLDEIKSHLALPRDH